MAHGRSLRTIVPLLLAALIAAGCSAVGLGGDEEARADEQALAPEAGITDAADGDEDGDEATTTTTGDTGGAPARPPFDPVAYQENLDLLLASTVRNTNHDDSPYIDVPSAELVLEDLYGPRSDYLQDAGGNSEIAFPTEAGGQFRTACEFSHFSYDDPLVFPGQPGAAHLHMFFGNTHVNAHSTYDTLLNSGSSTCNGMELNRTGYWVPAMFDGEGNVRIPERVVIYYKGEGFSNGNSVPYPAEAAFLASENINEISYEDGGAEFKFSYVCSDEWSVSAEPYANTMPNCDGDAFFDLYGVVDEPHVVLEMNVKFPQCWSGDDPADYVNSYSVPTTGSGWYISECGGDYPVNLPNMEYFVNYRVELGETTEDWYLSSDVDPATFERSSEPAGSSIHGDWWGAWNREVNQMWIDNCVNYQADPVSGCGFGFLTDGGPDQANPLPGPALLYRPQYEGRYKIPASEIFEQLCSPLADRAYTQPTDAAYCLSPQS